MKVLKEFSHDEIARAMQVFDASRAPRTEELLLELESTFSLSDQEASWLYNSIVFARPLMGAFKSIRIAEAATVVGQLPEGSRLNDIYAYVVIR